MYKHETDRPSQERHPMAHKPENDYGCADFKSDAFDQAYGQGSRQGYMADMKKIHSQHLNVYSDDSSGKEA